MNLKTSSISATLLLTFLLSTSFAQFSKKGYNKCEAIITFLNHPKIFLAFNRDYLKGDTSYIIVDATKSIDSCKINHWRGLPANVISSGILYDSVMQHNLLTGNQRRNLYIFSIGYDDKKPISMNILHGTHILVTCRVELINGLYYLTRFES